MVIVLIKIVNNHFFMNNDQIKSLLIAQAVSNPYVQNAMKLNIKQVIVMSKKSKIFIILLKMTYNGNGVSAQIVNFNLLKTIQQNAIIFTVIVNKIFAIYVSLTEYL